MPMDAFASKERERSRVQQAWMKGDVPVIVATIAFGTRDVIIACVAPKSRQGSFLLAPYGLDQTFGFRAHVAFFFISPRACGLRF